MIHCSKELTFEPPRDYFGLLTSAWTQFWSSEVIQYKLEIGTDTIPESSRITFWEVQTVDQTLFLYFINKQTYSFYNRIHYSSSQPKNFIKEEDPLFSVTQESFYSPGDFILFPIIHQGGTEKLSQSSKQIASLLWKHFLKDPITNFHKWTSYTAQFLRDNS